MGGSGEYYQKHKFLTLKQARACQKCRVVKETFEEYGKALSRFLLVTPEGSVSGKLDVTRDWVRKLIIAQEDREGHVVAVAENNDSGRSPSQPGEREEGWSA